MMLEIPFYENKGEQCMQAAMQSVLKYFLNKEYSLSELDKLTGRKDKFYTWTSQIVPVLYDLGLNVKYFSKSNPEPFLGGEPFIRKYFGKDANRILKVTDLPVFIKSIEKLMKYDIFERKALSLNKLENYVIKGYISLALIDNNKILGKEGYNGHLVVLTGFDDKNIYYHDSGPINPEPNKKISKDIFIKAFNANGTDNDVVVCFGKR